MQTSLRLKSTVVSRLDVWRKWGDVAYGCRNGVVQRCPLLQCRGRRRQHRASCLPILGYITHRLRDSCPITSQASRPARAQSKELSATPVYAGPGQTKIVQFCSEDLDMDALELAHTIFGRLVAKCVHHGYVGNPPRLGIYGTCQLGRKITCLCVVCRERGLALGLCRGVWRPRATSHNGATKPPTQMKKGSGDRYAGLSYSVEIVLVG
jgi:hypothetical protein